MRLESDEKEIILICDTNCNFKNNKNANSKKLKSIYSEYQLEQLIKRYTRVAITTAEPGQQKVSKTLIDHFSSNNPKYIYQQFRMSPAKFEEMLNLVAPRIAKCSLQREPVGPSERLCSTLHYW